jgi:hypothetical protein
MNLCRTDWRICTKTAARSRAAVKVSTNPAKGVWGSKIPHLPIKFGDSFAEFAKNSALSGIFYPK